MQQVAAAVQTPPPRVRLYVACVALGLRRRGGSAGPSTSRRVAAKDPAEGDIVISSRLAVLSAGGSGRHKSIYCSAVSLLCARYVCMYDDGRPRNQLLFGQLVSAPAAF